MKKAWAFADQPLSLTRFDYLHRVKKREYWEDISRNMGGVMTKQVRSDTGHTASPIRGRLSGLFFSTKLWAGQFPYTSPFGDSRYIILADKLLNPDFIDLYFADFYCVRNPQQHYITIIAVSKGSAEAAENRRLLPALSPLPRDNPFVEIEDSPHGFQYYSPMRDDVWVEIFWVGCDIPIHWGELGIGNVKPLGEGQSRPEGVGHNTTCTLCNL